MVDSVLFDLDGVVLKSEPLKEKAHESAVKSFGGKLPKDTYKRVLGESSKYVFDFIKKASMIEVGYEDYNHRFLDIYHGILGDCSFTNGFFDFFKILNGKRYKIGIITSSSEKTLKKISILDMILDDIDCIVCAENVKEHKPSPMPYLKGIELIRKDPLQILAFEDTTSGIKSARLSGLNVIGIKHEHAKFQNFDGTLSVWENFLGDKYTSLELLYR